MTSLLADPEAALGHRPLVLASRFPNKEGHVDFENELKISGEDFLECLKRGHGLAIAVESAEPLGFLGELVTKQQKIMVTQSRIWNPNREVGCSSGCLVLYKYGYLDAPAPST